MKNVKIPRLVKEDGVNPNTMISYNNIQLNEEINNYINKKFGYVVKYKNILKTNGCINKTKFYTIDPRLIIGRVRGYDKENIYVDFKSKGEYEEFLKYKNPKALFSLLVDYNKSTNSYDIIKLVKIEIGDINKKGDVINE